MGGLAKTCCGTGGVNGGVTSDSNAGGEQMAEVRDLQYLVLPDAANPYLLARVRWPDVCQAISHGRPVWQEDPGLFDLPHHPSATRVALEEATRIAARWGVVIDPDDTVYASDATFIRRMPSNWANLSPAEVRAWALDTWQPRQRATAPDGVMVASRRRDWRTVAFGWLRRRRGPAPQGLGEAPVGPVLSTGIAADASVDGIEERQAPIVVSGPAIDLARANGLATLANLRDTVAVNSRDLVDADDVVIDLRSHDRDPEPFADESATS